ANPDTRVFCHSDGNIAPLIPDLTETGIDILDPLRPECVNPARTIRKIWRSLVILGRGQRTTQDDDGSTR
ncbi:MAG: hypothetical protein M1588_04060, partial [Planctomycetes bacterium]|nr:hypothetical protein [Planctomycetota bacterium]